MTGGGGLVAAAPVTTTVLYCDDIHTYLKGMFMMLTLLHYSNV